MTFTEFQLRNTRWRQSLVSETFQFQFLKVLNGESLWMLISDHALELYYSSSLVFCLIRKSRGGKNCDSQCEKGFCAIAPRFQDICYILFKRFW